MELSDIMNDIENGFVNGIELKEEDYNFNKLKSVDIILINDT